MKSSVATLIGGLVWCAMACSDDGGVVVSDSGTPDADAAGDTGSDPGDDNDQADSDAVADMPTSDEGDSAGDVPDSGRTCGRPVAADEIVTYDVISPLAMFTGTAMVTLEGLAVSIVIPDDPEPITAEATFEAGERCIAASFEGIDANVCFFNADGSAAAAESLGAQLFAFVASGPIDTPDPTLLGGIRREMDLPCSVAGFFELDDSIVVAAGDVPADVIAAIREDYLGFLAIFETGGGDAQIAIGLEPISEPVETISVLTGDLETSFVIAAEYDVDASSEIFELDVLIDGGINLVTGELTADLTIEIAGESSAGTLSGPITGQRR